VEIGNIIARLHLDISDFIRSVQEARDRVKDIKPDVEGFEASKRKLHEFSSAMSAIGNRFLAIGTAIVSSLTAVMYTAAKAGDRMYEYSLRTGMTVENLSALSYAAEQTGTDINALLWSFKFLERQMVEAMLGAERARERFNSLGVAVTDASGRMRPVMDVILDIADALASLSTQQERAGFASRVFGLRYGPALVPMLSQGRKALEELMKTAEDLNIVMSTEAAMALDNFRDSVITAYHAIAAVGRELSVAMTPVVTTLTSIVAKVASMVSRFVESQPALSRFLVSFTMISGAAMVVIGSLSRFVSFLTRLQAEVGGVVSALKMLGTTVLSMLVNPITIAMSAVSGFAIALLVVSQRVDSFAESIRSVGNELRSAMDTRSVDALTSAIERTNEKIVEGYRALGVWKTRLEAIMRLGPVALPAQVIALYGYRRAITEVSEAIADMLVEQQRAHMVLREELEKVVGTRLQELGVTADVATKYITLTSRYQEAEKNLKAIDMAVRELNDQYSAGKLNAEVYARVMERLNEIQKENTSILEGTSQELNELIRLYPDVASKAEELRKELASSLVTIDEYYTSISRTADIIAKAYELPLQKVIEMRTEILRAFEGTEAEARAREDLVSGIVRGIEKSRAEMQEAYSEFEKLVRKAEDIRQEFRQSMEEANRRYRESVIDLANTIRSAYELQLDVPRLVEFSKALDFINTIIAQKTAEANRIYELAHADRQRILTMSTENLLEIEKSFVEQMIEIDAEWGRRQRDLNNQLVSLRSQLISILDKFYDFRVLVKASDAELMRLANRLRKGVRIEAPESEAEKVYREWYQAIESLNEIEENIQETRKQQASLEEERLKRETELRQRLIDEALQMRRQVVGFMEDLESYSEKLTQSISESAAEFARKTQDIVRSAHDLAVAFEESGIRVSMLHEALEKVFKVPVAEGFDELSQSLLQFREVSQALQPVTALAKALQDITGTKIVLDTGTFRNQIEELRRLVDSIPEEKIIRIKVIRETGTSRGNGNLRDLVIESYDEFINSRF